MFCVCVGGVGMCVCVCVCVCDHFKYLLIPAESTLNMYHLYNASLYKCLLLFVYTVKTCQFFLNSVLL